MSGPAEQGGRPGRALVYLAEDTVADLVGLPEGMRVVGVSADFTRTAVVVLVESDGLPSLPPGGLPPTLAGEADVDYRFDPDGDDGGGDLWVRWRWRTEGPRERPRYGCGFADCDRPSRLALAVRTRRDVYHLQARPGALLLCREHASAPPADWGGLPEPAAGSPEGSG